MIDSFDRLCDGQKSRLQKIYDDSYAGMNTVSEHARRSIMQHATSTASRLRKMAYDKFGGFVDDSQFDEMFEKPLQNMMEYASKQVSRIEDVKPPKEMQDEIDALADRFVLGHDLMMDKAIGCAMWLVGDEVGREIVVEVFGL